MPRWQRALVERSIDTNGRCRPRQNRCVRWKSGDESDEIPWKSAETPEVHLHDEDGQHNESARDNVPEAHGVPLECASGSVLARNSSGDRNESNALPDASIVIPEHADSSSELKDTEETTEVGSGGCQRRTSVCTWTRGGGRQVSQRRLRERSKFANNNQ